MKRLFLDCEFTNLESPSLISIGLVSEDDALAFYGVCEDFDRSACSEFVRSRVLPLLHQPVPGAGAAAGGTMPLRHLRHALTDWLQAIPGEVEILFEAEIDWALFKDLVGHVPGRIQGRNAREDVAWIGDWHGEYAHHALHDARCLRFDWLHRGGTGEAV